MKNLRLKLNNGDIFKIIHENEVRYFQYFYTEQNYLSADLVWIFNHKEDTDDIDLITASGYNFYLYTTIRAGVKMGLFVKIGNNAIPDNMKFIPKFRWTDNNLKMEINDWYILQGGNKKYIGKNLTENDKKLPFASVNFPKGAIEDMILGYKSFMKKTEFPYFDINK